MVFPLFQSLRPFYVATAMTYGTKANIVVPSPETYVKSALYTLGLSRRNTGYWSHGIQVFHYFIYSFSCYFSFSRIPYLTPHSIFSFFFFFFLLAVVLVLGIFILVTEWGFTLYFASETNERFTSGQKNKQRKTK